MTVTRLAPDLQPLVAEAAGGFDIDPLLTEAHASRESSGLPWVTKYESGWRYFFLTNGQVQDPGPRRGIDAPSLAVLDNVERIAQATSFGLLQIMGAVARELGYKGCLWAIRENPLLGLKLGCEKYARLLHVLGNTRDALAAYNAGSGNLAAGYAYADDVQERYEALKESA